MTWPYPGDSPVVIARRVAWVYRQRLNEIAPGSCALVDRMMTDMGQHWVVPRLVTARPDEWVNAHDAAAILAIGLSGLRELRRAGRITGRRNSARRYEYLVADLLALGANPRPRKKGTT